MPVSVKHQTILIHVPKTAGTSIEKVMGVYARRDCLHGVSNNHCLQHMTAKEMIDLMGKKLYQDFYSFAIVRNPWDRCVSEYAFLQKVGNSLVKGLTFSDFVYKLPVTQGSVPEYIFQHLRPQADYLFDEDGDCLVDYVGAFEDLHMHWRNIVREIQYRSGIQLTDKLPMNHTSQHDHYSKYYDIRTREWIANIYQDDIKNHHYEFESK